MNHLEDRIEPRKSATGFFFNFHRRENIFRKKLDYRYRKVFLIAAEKWKLLFDH